MKLEELIYKLEIVRYQKSISKFDLDNISREEKRLEGILVDSISFSPRVIARLISYLILAKEGKIFIPVNGMYRRDTWYRYIVLVEANEFNKKGNQNFDKYDDQILIFNSLSSFHDDDILYSHSLTFEQLINEYQLNEKILEKRCIKVCPSKFAEREYINDFIKYLVNLQIEKDGKYLTEIEMLAAMSNFINFEKDKPKTKGLNRN